MANKAYRAKMADGHGPVFFIEACSFANPRWKRWNKEPYPTFAAAEAKLQMITHGADRRNRLFRIASYERTADHPTEATEDMFI